jgi:hypothetical protein
MATRGLLCPHPSPTKILSLTGSYGKSLNIHPAQTTITCLLRWCISAKHLPYDGGMRCMLAACCSAPTIQRKDFSTAHICTYTRTRTHTHTAREKKGKGPSARCALHFAVPTYMEGTHGRGLEGADYHLGILLTHHMSPHITIHLSPSLFYS